MLCNAVCINLTHSSAKRCAHEVERHVKLGTYYVIHNFISAFLGLVLSNEPIEPYQRMHICIYPMMTNHNNYQITYCTRNHGPTLKNPKIVYKNRWVEYSSSELSE